MKKTKEEDTSAGTPKKKKPQNKGRLSSMLESMQKRSSPLNAHKVATKYFEDFKKDRSISDTEESPKVATAVDTGVITVEGSTVTTAVEKKTRKQPPSKAQNKTIESKILDDSHSTSETKVYLFMREACMSKKSTQLRFGLKKLKEKTGLSDKTIRTAIHSLEEKLSIKIVEPSLGVYGRMIRVFDSEEIISRRKKAGLIIDSTTKKIIDKTTAVSSAVDSAVTTAIVNKRNYKRAVMTLYNKYTDNDWDDRAEKFYKTISHLKPETVEAVFILGILKDKKRNKHITEFETLIKDMRDSLSKTHIDHLRDIWKDFQAKEGKQK